MRIAARFEPGALVVGPFPRMGGKRRPAACVHLAANGAVALCPGTSVRSAQPGRVALASGRFGKPSPTYLIAPLATLFPPGAPRLLNFDAAGRLEPSERVELWRALAEAYGPDWRARFEARADRIKLEARLQPLGQGARRRRVLD